MTTLDFGSYHHEYDPLKHEAAWGARLIYREVLDGGDGIVWDRIASINPDALVKNRWLGAVGKFLDLVRASGLSGGSEEVLGLREAVDGGRKFFTVVGSPQGSHGYLYVTLTLEDSQ